jgi:hypothetical protein
VLRAQGRLIVVASTDPSAGYHLSDDDNCVVDHRRPDFRSGAANQRASGAEPGGGDL